MDSRPSELDPYPRTERDLSSAVLWQRSLHRSHRRRIRAREARRNAPRQKGATLAAGAAILAAPVLSPLSGAASASSARPGATKAEVAEKAAVSGEKTWLLSYGDTGEAVAAVQGLLGIPADGIFGPQTEGAVKTFQLNQGLAATGIVDAKTWAELFGSKVLFYGEADASAASVRRRGCRGFCEQRGRRDRERRAHRCRPRGLGRRSGQRRFCGALGPAAAAAGARRLGARRLGACDRRRDPRPATRRRLSRRRSSRRPRRSPPATVAPPTAAWSRRSTAPSPARSARIAAITRTAGPTSRRRPAPPCGPPSAAPSACPAPRAATARWSASATPARPPRATPTCPSAAWPSTST